MIVLENLTEMLKGVLEGCVLEIIDRKETYGYEITRRLNALGFTDVVDGTVYTILVRLERGKLVDVTKKPSDMASRNIVRNARTSYSERSRNKTDSNPIRFQRSMKDAPSRFTSTS